MKTIVKMAAAAGLIAALFSFCLTGMKASAYYADAFGNREAIPELIEEAEAEESSEPAEEELQDEANDADAEAGEDESIEDPEEECEHKRTQKFSACDPDSYWWELDCMDCGLVLEEWAMTEEEWLNVTDYPDESDTDEDSEEAEEDESFIDEEWEEDAECSE